MDELLQDYFGEFGGQFAAETLIEPLEELSRGFRSAVSDPDFSWQLSELNKHYIGRESPLTLIERTSEQLDVSVTQKNSSQVDYMKEDLSRPTK